MHIFGNDTLIEGKLIRIARLDAEGYDFVEDPEAVLKTLRDARDRVDLFSFIQKLSDPTPRYNYPMEWDNLAAMKISTFEHWMAHQVDFKVRNKVRKATKTGVVVREVPFDEELIKGISAIYNEVPVRQGKSFWHCGKDFEAVRRMNGTFLSRSIFLGAFLEEKLIGFVKLVTSEDRTQAGLMQIISMMQCRDKAPTNALIAQAVRSCAERNISHLWYANFSYGNKKSDSLADFKRYNGFKKVELPRYYVPLTTIGRIALRLDLHRSLANWIPEPIAATYRELRSSWYARRFRRASNGYPEHAG
jgi:hypothetical protein